MDALIAFTLAALALVGSPGPATLGLAATGAAFGVRGGLIFMTGIVTGMMVVIAITASGLTAVVLALPGARAVLGTVAAVYLGYLAYRIARAPGLDTARPEAEAPAFGGGVLLTLVNPKAYAAMAALFGGFVLVSGRPAMDAALKLGVLVPLMIASNLVWLALGAALARSVQSPRLARAINLIFAALLIAAAALVLLI